MIASGISSMPSSDAPSASRGDVLRNPHAKNMVPNADHTKSYRPDLRYLSEGTATSLASRLAHKLEKPQMATSSDTPDMSGAKERPIDHTIAQRRAARLAREQARRQPSEGQRTSLRPVDLQRRSSHPRPQFDGTGQLVSRQDDHDKTRSPRPNSGRGGQQSQHGSLSSPGIAGTRWSAGNDSSRGSDSRRAKPQAVRGGSLPYRAVRTGEEMSSSEDISLEILEEGGDEKEQAEFKDPDAIFADLDEVFGRLGSRPHSVQVSPRQTEVSVAYPKRVQEASSGDYARFAPYSSGDFLVSHHKINPMKHVQLVLSKRGDVPITARHRALRIVQSSMSEAAATRRV